MFYDKLKEDKIIKLKIKQIDNGSLLFVKLIKNKKQKNDLNETKKMNNNKVNQMAQMQKNDISMKQKMNNNASNDTRAKQ